MRVGGQKDAWMCWESAALPRGGDSMLTASTDTAIAAGGNPPVTSPPPRDPTLASRTATSGCNTALPTSDLRSSLTSWQDAVPGPDSAVLTGAQQTSSCIAVREGRAPSAWSPAQPSGFHGCATFPKTPRSLRDCGLEVPALPKAQKEDIVQAHSAQHRATEVTPQAI